jgi:hypothetical protein
MSISLNGYVLEAAFDNVNKFVRFIIQDDEGYQILCEYTYECNFPLKINDTVNINGDFRLKIIAGEKKNVFECNFLTAVYNFDLLSFLMQYMPYMKESAKNPIENVTKFYRESCDRIMEFCIIKMRTYSIDNIFKLFCGLYKSIVINDEDSLIEFGKSCFCSPDLKKIKYFLKLWNKNVLIRPLELMGLTLDEIDSIHIPLYEAYEIVKTNPLRFPQISIEKAMKIITHHLRLNPEPSDYNEPINHLELKYISNEAVFCGIISRMVYDNLIQRKWSSTPISKIKDKYPIYDKYIDDIKKYYFCREEYEHLYFEIPYGIEVSLAKKMSKLIMKKSITINPPLYPGLIPTKNQQEAIEGSVSNWASMIFGGPGTGKTDVVLSSIIRTISSMGQKSICLAFTGAATSRIRDTTTKNGVFDLTYIYTVNMAITLFSKIIEMDVKYVIIDEISMINSGLMAEFISVFRSLDYHFIFIGDSNQLEPIKWGNFMIQLLKTPIKKYELTENFRSEKSIIGILNEIIDPERIISHKNVNWNVPSSDYRINTGDINMLEQWIAYYANQFKMDETISREDNILKFNEYRDKFTIVCPYKKVCDQVNIIFQKYFMAPIETESTILNEEIYYLGDRVMKLVNDYGINVMNGEQGKIIKVTPNYIVCKFRGKDETITPYIEKNKFKFMKELVKNNGIVFNPYNQLKDGDKKEKTKDEIKKEIDHLKSIYLPQISNEESIEPNRKIIELYFELLEEYPFAMYNIKEESEFLNIKTICLAYALTTHKSQGSQYEFVIFFLNGKFNCFVTVNNLYTGLSRAKTFLHIISESMELLNSVSLTKQRYVYDKLYHKINSLLPPEMVESIIEIKTIYMKDETFLNDDNNDEIEFEEFFDDIGY